MNADGSDQTRLTNDTAVGNAPAWSPDGSQIAFHSNLAGNDIYAMNADGSDVTQLTSNAADDQLLSWQPVSPTRQQNPPPERPYPRDPAGGCTPITGQTPRPSAPSCCFP